jgi:RNA polymerase sigma-70 factor (ECF subfamily)
MSGGDDGDEDGPGAGVDPRDFEAVYAEQADGLRAYGASLLRGAGLVDHSEDVVQEAIIGLWKTFKVTGEVPRSWVAVMMNAVKFRALDLIKSATVRHAGFSMDEDDSTFELAVVRDFTVDHAESSPARAALEALEDAQQREVLYLLYYEDKTQAQAAEELGLSPGRITQVKQAALKEIAAHIDGY